MDNRLTWAPPDTTGYTPIHIDSGGNTTSNGVGINLLSLTPGTDYVVTSPDVIDGIGPTKTFDEQGPNTDTFLWTGPGLPTHSATTLGGFDTITDQNCWNMAVSTTNCSTVNATTGSFDLIFYATINNKTGSAKLGGWNYDVESYIQSGELRARVRQSNGTSIYWLGGASSAANNCTNGVGQWWRCHINAVNDTVTWYKSSDARTVAPTSVSWTSITSVVSAWDGTAANTTDVFMATQMTATNDTLGRAWMAINGVAKIDVDPANIPDTVLNSVRINFRYGRNIVWIGAEFEINDQLRGDAAVIQLGSAVSMSQTGIVHLEGMRFRGSYMNEAFDLRSPQATVQLQNIHIDHQVYLDNQNQGHPDMIQPTSGFGELRVDRFTGHTEYQGFFLRVSTNQAPPGGQIWLRRVDLTAVDTVNGDGFPTGSGPGNTPKLFSFWCYETATDSPNAPYFGNQPPYGEYSTGIIYGEDLYVNKGTTTVPYHWWLVTIADPDEYSDHEPDNKTNDIYSWNAPHDTRFRSWDGLSVGQIKGGARPDGNYVTASSVGIGYLTPGYGYSPLTYREPPLVWGKVNEKSYEFGIDRGVFYPYVGSAIALPGLISVSEDEIESVILNSSIDGRPYANLWFSGVYSAKVNLYNIPDSVYEHLGFINALPGLRLADQWPSHFNFSYRTMVNENDYKIHLIYNAIGTLSNQTSGTINNTASAKVSEINITSVPPSSETFRPSAHIVVSSENTNPTFLTLIENALYGTTLANPYFPTQQQIQDMYIP